MEILSQKGPEIEALCRKYGVRRLRLFGSALRPDWDEATSDFDFVADFGELPEGIGRFDQQFGLLVDLERLLGRPVDLVDWGAAEKPYFREIVETTAVELYAA